MTRNWYYWAGNREAGPLTLKELNQIAAQRRIGAETLVREGKEGSWIPAAGVKGFITASVDAPDGRDGPPPLPSFDRNQQVLKSNEQRKEKPQTYLYAGVTVCALMAVIAVASILQDDRNRASQVASPISLPAANSARASIHPNWIAGVKSRAIRGVVLVKTSDQFGSGFVVASRNGRNLIVTNKHVLVGEEFNETAAQDYPKSYSVVSESGNNMRGQLAGLAADNSLDLALLLVRSAELEVLGRIGSMEQVEIGDPVVAVGNPLDPLLANTVTNGIISGKHGPILQTNAAINHGNSGGPLLNERGEIVGVNTIGVDKQFAEGIGFAIGADVIRRKGTWRFLEPVSDLIVEMPK